MGPPEAHAESDPAWAWIARGRTPGVLGSTGVIGAVLLIVGVGLVVTSASGSDTQSPTTGAGFLAGAMGLVLLLAAVGLWFGRESIVLWEDGVLEHRVRDRRTQAIDVAALDEVAVVRRAVTKQVHAPDGGSGTKTVYLACIGPAAQLDRLGTGARLPDWIVLKTFPWGRADELRAELARFAAVHPVD